MGMISLKRPYPSSSIFEARVRCESFRLSLLLLQLTAVRESVLRLINKFSSSKTGTADVLR